MCEAVEVWAFTRESFGCQRRIDGRQRAWRPGLAENVYVNRRADVSNAGFKRQELHHQAADEPPPDGRTSTRSATLSPRRRLVSSGGWRSICVIAAAALAWLPGGPWGRHA